MSGDYRLVWFQHFHKAGGSTLVDLARRNGERFWPDHENGNPRGDDGRLIPLWEYTADKLGKFVDDCQAGGVTFVATEWGVPDMAALAADSRVYTVTCLRAPLSRFLSNFYYDLYNGYTEATTPSHYVDTRGRAFTMPDYYVRLLSGLGNTAAPVEEEHYAAAMDRLDLFDACLVLEKGFAPLADCLGWEVPALHTNSTALGPRQFLSLLVRFKWRPLISRLRYPRRPPATALVQEFQQQNRWDFALYNRVRGDGAGELSDRR